MRQVLLAFKQWLEFVAAIFAAGTTIAVGLFAGYRYMLLPSFKQYRALAQTLVHIAQFSEVVTALKKDLAEIRAELRPNGGTSLRDVVDTMALELTRNGGIQRRLLNASSVPQFHCDALGEYYFVNEAYLELVGRDYDEVMDLNWLNCIAIEARETVEEVWNHCVRDKRIFEMPFDYVQPTGKRIPVLCRAEPVFDRNQKVVMWIGSIYVKSPTTNAA